MNDLLHFLAVAMPRETPHGAFTNVTMQDGPEHQVRYTSGGVFYTEGLVGDRWAARSWAMDDRIPFPYRLSSSPSFDIHIKMNPTSAHSAHAAGGWAWVSAAEAPRTDRGARHFIVELRNTQHPLDVTVHTVLDRTPGVHPVAGDHEHVGHCAGADPPVAIVRSVMAIGQFVTPTVPARSRDSHDLPSIRLDDGAGRTITRR